MTQYLFMLTWIFIWNIADKTDHSESLALQGRDLLLTSPSPKSKIQSQSPALKEPPTLQLFYLLLLASRAYTFSLAGPTLYLAGLPLWLAGPPLELARLMLELDGTPTLGWATSKLGWAIPHTLLGHPYTLGLKQMLDFFFVGNFWKKSIFRAFLGLKNSFLTTL